MTTPTIQQAIQQYIEMKANSRNKSTASTYQYALQRYSDVLANHKLPPDSPTDQITEQSAAWFLEDLKSLAVATEKLYTAAMTDFFTYLMAENINSLNMPKVRQLIKQRGRMQSEPIYNYATDSVEHLIACADKLMEAQSESDNDRLINLRDRALIITLADTGLRIHEACNLNRSDIDMNTGQAVIVGKGNKQAVVRFSTRSIQTIRDYLSIRTPLLDGKSGKPLGSLPLFARHDRGAGKKVKRMTTATGRNIIDARVVEYLGAEHAGEITPHTLRHRFVTNVLRSSGNLKLAKDLARHTNIGITQRYAHLTDQELDNGYRKAFEKE